jgi:hypothetical protein
MRALWPSRWLLAVMTLQSPEARYTQIQAGALLDGCSIQLRPTGGGYGASMGAWLFCGGDRKGFLLAHPLNLLGRVKIQTTAQALEHVRIFSSSEWYLLFPGRKIVEVLPAKTDGVFRLEASKFRSHCREASVTETREAGDLRFFEIRRTAVSLDDRNLYEVLESVSETGDYRLVSKRLLFKDAKKLGILFSIVM